MENVRVRFAPSPTGHLHIGGARTALFNYLFARNQGGAFILRIEDTDRSRSTEEYIGSIFEGMKWLSLHWDEGPFRQTDRSAVYSENAQRLLMSGAAYRCYCTPEELEDRRQEALSKGLPLKYDGRCRRLKLPVPGRPSSIRFKMPEEGQVVVNDLVKGNIVFENSQLDDLIIVRSDGTPTYNFCVVVDDVEMRITHVIRGDDHLNNTPKQIHIYKALGYEIPVFAHLPMILGPDKTRLSKRHGATSVTAYRDGGYLPEALVNYLVRLGWSHGDQEVFTREELVRLFSFEHVGASPSVFNPEKLIWLNGEYMRLSPPGKLSALLGPFLVSREIIAEGAALDEEWLKKAVSTLRERSKTLIELADSMKFYIAEDVDFEQKAMNKFLTEKTLPYLKDIRDRLSRVESFGAEPLHKAFTEVTGKHGVKLGAVAQPVRVAITGRAESPGIFEVLEIIGREKALRRLDRAIGTIEKK